MPGIKDDTGVIREKLEWSSFPRQPREAVEKAHRVTNNDVRLPDDTAPFFYRLSSDYLKSPEIRIKIEGLGDDESKPKKDPHKLTYGVTITFDGKTYEFFTDEIGGHSKGFKFVDHREHPIFVDRYNTVTLKGQLIENF